VPTFRDYLNGPIEEEISARLRWAGHVEGMEEICMHICKQKD
jgi:hypothetical protein